MELEKEIKQSHFKTPASKAILNVMYTGSWLMAKTHQVLKPFGISPEQYNVLRILRGSKSEFSTLSDIQERMLDRMSNATRLVEKLKLKNYLTRNECKSNRRKVDIKITTEGLRLLSQIDSHMSESEAQLVSKLSAQEIDTLNLILDKVR